MAGWEVVSRGPAADPWRVTNRSKAERPGMLSSLGAAFGQGLSLGTSDELQAATEAALGSGSYRDSRNRQQREREEFSSEHPWLSATATATGAALPVLGSLLLAPQTAGAAPVAAGARAIDMVRNAFVGRAFPAATGAGQAIGQGMAYGAGFGAPAGYASADPESGGGRLLGTAKGLATGSLLGGAIPGLLAVRDQVAATAGKYVPALQRTAEGLGVQAGPIASSAAPINRPPPRGPAPPATAAEARLLRSLQEGGMAPETAGGVMDEARKLGVPLSLLDVGGQPTQRLARGVRTLPGSGSAIIDSALEARAAGQPARVQNFVAEGLGQAPTGNSGRTLDDLLELARQRSEPLYSALEVIPVTDPKVIELLNEPGAVDILTRLQTARSKFPSGSRPPLFGEDGAMVRAPTLADVNDVNVTINEMLRPQYQAMGGRPMEGVDLMTREGRGLAQGFQKRLNAAADSMLGGDWYSVARKSYAGPAAARSQYERGLDFTSPRTGLEDVSTQATEGADWYRRGVADSIDQKIGAMPDLGQRPNVLRSFWGNPNARGKFNEALLPENAGKTRQRLDLENQAAQSSNFIRSGSQTADKFAEAVDVAADLGTKVVSGANPKAEAARALWGKVRGQFGERTREEIARALTAIDPAKQSAIIERLIELNSAGKLRADTVGSVARSISMEGPESRRRRQR